MHQLLRQIAAVLSCVAISIAFQPMALAQATVDQDFERVQRWYALQLKTAQAVDAAMTQVGNCLEQRETALDRRIDELETVIGTLAAEEKKLSALVSTLSTAQRLLEDDLQDAEGKFVNANEKFKNLPGRAEYEEWKRACDSKSPDFSIYVCSYGNRNVSILSKTEAELPGLRRRIDIARDTRDGASARLVENRRLMAVARQDLGRTKQEKLGRNLEVADVKKWLFEVRDIMVPIRLVVNRIESTLALSQKVDAAAERRRTLLKMTAITEDIDRSLNQVNVQVEHYNAVLPQGWDSSCKRG